MPPGARDADEIAPELTRPFRPTYRFGMAHPYRGASVVLLSLVALAACRAARPDVEERFHAFADASARHDLAALRGFYAPDVTWQIGPRVLHGVDEVMAFHENDRALGARFERDNVRVFGDTVVHDMTETNLLFQLLRVPPLRHTGVAFVYADGLIVWKGPAPGGATPADSMSAFLADYLGPFRRWWTGAHPELRDSVLTAEGELRAGAPGARIRLRLAREYVVLQYIDAANRHDLDWIRGLFTDDVTWDLAGDVRRGLDEVMAPHEQDVVTETHLDITVRRVGGDTVLTDVVERNAFVAALGFDSLPHSGIAFVFRGPKIAHLGPVDAEAEGPSNFEQALVPFFAWIREEHPDDWATLVDEDGRPRYGREGGRTLMRLVATWKGRRPGREWEGRPRPPLP